MKALRQWGKDKPYIIKIFAAQLLSNVQDMSEEFRTIKLRRFYSQKFPLPHLPSWFLLYRSHRRNIAHIKSVFTAVYGKYTIQSLSKILERPGKSATSLPAPSKEQIKDAIKLLQTLYSVSEKELEDDFNLVPVRIAAKRRMSALIEKSPLETSFYLFVTVPCWTLYRVSPTQLYRKARTGDFDALQKLLCLDQLMLHDPAIGRQIISYRFNRSASKYRKLLAAATKTPKGSNSRKNILLSQIGLISAISQLTVKPLTPQDLFDLVDAFDLDSKGKLLADLPKTPEALARALAPDRNLWRQVFPTQTK